MVPEKIEVFEPIIASKAEKSFWDSTKADAKQTENNIQPTSEGSIEIAKNIS